MLNGFDLEKNASITFSMSQDNKTSFEVSASNRTSIFDFGGAFINQTFRRAVGLDNISLQADSRAIFDCQGWPDRDQRILGIYDRKDTLVRELQLENGTKYIMDV